MIATLTEIKSFLRLSDTTYDTYITASIEPLQKWVETYLRNDFVSDRVVFNSYDLEFAGDNTITCENNEFGDYQFKSGIDIEVHGSFNNDDIYTVDTATASVLTINSAKTLVAEDSGNQAYLYKITIAKKEYPVGLKITFAKLIGFNIKNSSMDKSDRRLKSEDFINYNYESGTSPVIMDSGAYPKSILLELDAYRNKKLRLH